MSDWTKPSKPIHTPNYSDWTEEERARFFALRTRVYQGEYLSGEDILFYYLRKKAYERLKAAQAFMRRQRAQPDPCQGGAFSSMSQKKTLDAFIVDNHP